MALWQPDSLGAVLLRWKRKTSTATMQYKGAGHLEYLPGGTTANFFSSCCIYWRHHVLKVGCCRVNETMQFASRQTSSVHPTNGDMGPPAVEDIPRRQASGEQGSSPRPAAMQAKRGMMSGRQIRLK